MSSTGGVWIQVEQPIFSRQLDNPLEIHTPCVVDEKSSTEGVWIPTGTANI